MLRSLNIFILIIWFTSSRPEVYCKKGVLRNFEKFTGKQLRQNLFNKVAGLRPATLLKKRLWHRRFPVNFAEFLRTPFLREHLRWMLLLLFIVDKSQFMLLFRADNCASSFDVLISSSGFFFLWIKCVFRLRSCNSNWGYRVF